MTWITEDPLAMGHNLTLRCLENKVLNSKNLSKNIILAHLNQTAFSIV